MNAMGSMPLNEFYDRRFRERSRKQPECGDIAGAVNFFFSLNVDKTATILDIGTYIGTFVRRLTEAGWTSVIGVDIGEVSMRYGREKYPELAERLITYDGVRLPFPDAGFDVVTMFNVLEHLPDPVGFLPEVYRALRKNGTLILQTPNKYIDAVYETVKYRSFEWRQSHCSLQTPGSLRRLLAAADFHDITQYKRGLNTPYFQEKLRACLGGRATGVLRLMEKLPAALYPTISMSARKA